MTKEKTMKPIHQLDDTLISKIAAGEVVERPASVVKELVENSVDAGATKITIKIAEGGKKLIQIFDNGHGIPSDQLPLAVSRHATSKISKFDDLYHLHTKGFRGEALASIASVSQLELASAPKNAEPQEIIIHSGKLIDQRACALPQGTRVTVKYLFYETPARLKFLRTNETETSHIVEVITKMALSHPQVHFQLLQNDKMLIDAPTTDNPIDRVVNLLGKDLEEYLYPFAGEENGMQAQGFFGHPQVSRSQRKGVFFFVNGRAVNDKVLWHASLEAYRDLLMKGKYPVLVLDLKVDEATLDVNVHPQKSEIRFHHPQQVHAFVKKVLRTHLQESPWLKSVMASFSNSSAQPSFSPTQSSQPFSNTKNGVEASLQNWSQSYFQKSSEPTEANRPTQNFQKQPWSKPENLNRHFQFGKTQYADMQPIGQLLGTYILCECEDRLILIDQHAAHERVGFEKLMLQFQKEGIPSEPLLTPETFDLKPSDADLLKNYLEEFFQFGYEIDFFGGQTFVLKAEPILLKGKLSFPNLIQDLLADIQETGELVSLKDKLHHVLATMACHAQIRAHHLLSREEIQALLKELDEYQFTDFCPHGRPVSVEVTLEEIEKWFKRVL